MAIVPGTGRSKEIGQDENRDRLSQHRLYSPSPGCILCPDVVRGVPAPPDINC